MTVGARNSARAGRLPVEITNFVGRRGEVAEIKRLLAESRLVTLTGVGGCGKTRLALRVAAQLRRAFADGVWLVDLAPVTDEALIVHAVAAALDIGDLSHRSPLDVVVDVLRGRQVLLVLDNCEHVLDGCAAFTLAALRGAGGLRILCTSRQPLGMAGEQVWTVPPLAYPEPHGPLAPTASVRYSALALFALRAAAVSPGFVLTADNVATVAEICRRLDGLPLAIELAAARLRALSLDQLADSLQRGFPVLAARAATPAWHRTLEAAFDWSYQMCSPAERTTWQRVSVFADSFDLPAAQAVCAGDGMSDADMLPALAGLVDKSVLIRDEPATGVRYRLLATVREYGLSRLRAADTGREQVLRRRHAHWYRQLTNRFDAEWFGPRQQAWIEQITVELPNLRAAAQFCLSTPTDAQTGQRIAADLIFYWHAVALVHEGRHWCERVVAADAQPTADRLRALLAYAYSLYTQGDSDAAVARAREALDLAGRLDAPHLQARATYALGTALLVSGDLAAARPVLQDAVARLADLDNADAHRSYALNALAVTLLFQGEAQQADRVCAEARDICRTHGERWWLGYTVVASALAALALGDTARATGYVRESLRSRHDMHDVQGMAGSVERLAWIAATVGDYPRAARLLGAADQLWRIVGVTLYGAAQWLRGRQECEARTRQALGDQAYEQARRDGAVLSTDEAVRYALGDRPDRQPGPAGLATAEPAGASDSPLTPRELEVAQLVAQGLSNKQIAARLVLSRRTAESHVENILRKLGFTSRTQIAGWITQRDDQ
jgi:predicted ATPase/DNA-binding CsgD family transcriptional regulator